MSTENICKLEEISSDDNKTTETLLPEPRSGHRVVATDSNLYSIGGYNPDFWERENITDETYYPLFKELWKFNFISRQWTNLKTTGDMPLELASHSACLYGNNLVLYGGTGIPFGEASSNNVHICNLKTLEWKKLLTEGDPPTPGYGSVIHGEGKYLYVYGGTTGWEYNSDVHRLDLDTCIWKKLEPEGKAEPPEGRYRHESALYKNKLYIFGGGRAMSVFTLETLPVFDLENSIWDYLPCRPDPIHNFPQPRRCHSCVLFKDDVYICGGYNGEDIFGDLWKLNLNDLRWTKFHTELKRPCYFHSAAVAPNGCMYIHGGVVKLDVERTSSVTSVPLALLSLRELSWSSVTTSIKDIQNVPKEHLIKLGIPTDLVHRFQ